MDWYDRDGKLLDWEEAANKMEDRDYYRVALTHVTEGTSVSTVWLGISHQYGDGPPLIFETMVFSDVPAIDESQERYSTESEAIAGHLRWVEQVRAHLGLDPKNYISSENTQ
jgi:hypothetical protein